VRQQSALIGCPRNVLNNIFVFAVTFIYVCVWPVTGFPTLCKITWK